MNLHGRRVNISKNRNISGGEAHEQLQKVSFRCFTLEECYERPSSAKKTNKVAQKFITTRFKRS